MVTTRSVKEDIVEAMKAGVNNYIVKPFTPETLKAKIDQMLAGRSADQEMPQCRTSEQPAATHPEGDLRN